MHSYSATYYFSDSSQPYRAKLYLEKNRWRILVEDASLSFRKEIFWPVEQIVPKSVISEKSIFCFGSFPFQTIEVDGADFSKALLAFYPKADLVDQKFSWISSASTKSFLALALVFVLIVVGAYLFLLPKMANYIAGKTPISYEVKLGETLKENLLDEYTVSSDFSNALNDFASEIDFKSQYNIHFNGVEHSTINAFALPGGEIVIFDAIVQKMTHYEQLAALMAHEVAHVEERHSLKGLFRNIAGYAFVSFLVGDVNAILSVLAENAQSLHNLSFSRKLEESADAYGYEVLNQNRISTQGFIDLFKMLKEESEHTLDLSFLSTHPLPDERIERAHSYTEQQANFSHSEHLEEKFLYIQSLLKKSSDYEAD